MVGHHSVCERMAAGSCNNAGKWGIEELNMIAQISLF